MSDYMAVYHLYKDPTATVMILVPTQAIMWNHAKTLEDVSFKTAETEEKDPFQHIISISDEENLSGNILATVEELYPTVDGGKERYRAYTKCRNDRP